MREQTSVTFTMTSPTLTAQELQSRLGIEPDKTWKAGDRTGPFAVVAKEHGFVLETGVFPTEELDRHVKEMLKRLAPAAQKIGALGDAVKVEFVCAIHRKTAPRLRFDRDDLRWLGVMGAKLLVDVFLISDPPAARPGAGGAATGAAGGEKKP